jgi:hypothetical protein
VQRRLELRTSSKPPSPLPTLICSILRRTDPGGSRRREEEVRGRVDERGARAPAEADLRGRGPRKDADPRPRPLEGRHRRARERRTGARRPPDRRDAGDLRRHRRARARAVLPPGAGRRARTLGTRASIREVFGRARRGAADRAGVLGAAGGSGALEHAPLGGHKAMELGIVETISRETVRKTLKKTSFGPISSRGG